MKIIKANYQIVKPDLDDPKTEAMVYRDIEESGRTCYLSSASMTDETGAKFVRTMVKNGHDAMLEHTFMKVRFTVDRGISHEIVRHRLCSFAQESTRYCNYSKDKFGNEITVIEPCFFNDIPKDRKAGIMDYLDGILKPYEFNDDFTPSDRAFAEWYLACERAEASYFALLNEGRTPQEARTVLPHSLKTELMVTANMREWREIFKLRAAGEHGKPHPQMLEVMVPLLNECKLKLPALFEDIEAME